MQISSTDSENRQALLQDPDKWLSLNKEVSIPDHMPSLVSEWQALQQTQKNLKEDTGKLSRQIGACKKSQQPIDDLLVKMRAIKAQKEQLLAQQASCEEKLDSLLSELKTAEPADENASKPNEPLIELDHSKVIIADYTEAYQAECALFLNEQPGASIYHFPVWCSLIKKVFGHDYVYLLARYENEVVGVLPVVMLRSRLFGNFGVSMPYFNYGGPLAKTPEVEDLLLSEARKRAGVEQLEHVEYRCLHDLQDLPGHQDKVSMWLELPNAAEQLWQGIGTKIRAQIKKAERNQFVVQIGGEELLDAFYRVFAENMRDLGTPVYSKAFFAEILRSGAGARQIVVVSTAEGKPISASFLIGFNGRLEVPWASTLRKYNRYNANMLLYWQMLKFACEQGYTVFDFGRSSVDASTLRFKKQWGAKPVQLSWHYWLPDNAELPQLNTHNPKFQLAIKIWQKLPVWLTKLIGPVLVKNLP